MLGLNEVMCLLGYSCACNLWGHFMGQLKGQATQYTFQLVKQVDRGPFIVVK